jgi:hypothetical protein
LLNDAVAPAPASFVLGAEELVPPPRWREQLAVPVAHLEIDRVPVERDFETLRSRLADQQVDTMLARVKELIDAAGAEIATAGWLPGSDWNGTVFQPIFDKAARGDFDRSAKFFGQLVWYAVMHRPERWGSGKYEVDGRDIGSRTYFRLKASASR